MKKLALLLIFGLLFSAFTYDLSAQDDEYYDDEYYEDDYYGDEEPLNKFMPSIMAGYNLTMGDYNKFMGNSFGIYGQFEYRVMKHFAIGLKSGFIHWRQDYTGDNEFSVNVVPIDLMLYIYFQGTEDFQPYAGLDIGYENVYHIYHEFIGTSTQQQGGHKKDFQNHKTNISTFGFAPVGGVIMPFG